MLNLCLRTTRPNLYTTQYLVFSMYVCMCICLTFNVECRIYHDVVTYVVCAYHARHINISDFTLILIIYISGSDSICHPVFLENKKS